MPNRFTVALLCAASSCALAADYDLVIYGGTPAGIAAAIEAKRQGIKAVMIEPSPRIGGLTTGGLGRTDIGAKDAFGGIAREFYAAVADWYRDPAHWTRQTREDYANTMTRINDKRFIAEADTMWAFEPSVALKILEGWERRDGLEFVRGERLDRNPGKVVVDVNGGRRRIVSISMESGRVFCGKMFIDATYEGDLLAAAGVSYVVGREDNSTYGETINGIQRGAGSHKLMPGVDPYVVKGDPSSGLLPGVEAPQDDPRPNGSGDKRVQAYCYRMCLTDDLDNRIPFKKPDGFNELEYELFFRNCEQGDVHVHRNQGPLPNRKTDTNNDGGFSTDYIGQSWRWAEASYAEREEIAKRHLTYQQGLMWVLANHPRTPKELRDEYSKWGTCKDEFIGERGDGWQCQLYVREARRMVGEYVMTEHNARGRVKAPHPIAYAAYTMDSHHCRRYIGKDGFVHNEGDVQDAQLYPGMTGGKDQPWCGFGRYGVDYGALVPKKEECENLLVPVCISASHAAFGSIRMEPVFFAFGQSAAVAAALAIRADVAVQDVDYAELRKAITLSGQLVPPVPSAATDSFSTTVVGVGAVDVTFERSADGESTTRYACATPEKAAELYARRRNALLAFGDGTEGPDGVRFAGVGVFRLSRNDAVFVESFARNPSETAVPDNHILSFPHGVPDYVSTCLVMPSANTDSLGPSDGFEVWGRAIKSRYRRSLNGVYDVFLVVRDEKPVAGIPERSFGRAGFVLPDGDHGWIATPTHDFAPGEAVVAKVPRIDPEYAGLWWIRSIQAVPRIGTTVGFCNAIENYKSDSFFQGRPIVREMAANGLELRLYNGPGTNLWAQGLRQFNALWILIDQELSPKYDPDEVGRALRTYVEDGGGLVIDQTAGRYSESPVDAFWEKVMKHLEMNRLHEEIVDFTNHFWRATPHNWMFYTRNIKPHPVTDGVPGLWCPCRGNSQSMGSVAVDYPAGWDVIVRGEKSAKSYPKNRITNDIEYEKKGTFDAEPPLVAVRSLGKGRIVSIAVAKDNSGWMYNIDRWPNINERGEHDGLRSDFVRLHENALRWASEPSLAEKCFLRPYAPVEPEIMTYRPLPEYDFSREPMRYPAVKPGVKPGATGVVGLHSSHSDGTSTVAEYAAEAKRLGINYIVFTDPLDKIDEKGLAALRAECAMVSDELFYACPGVEYIDRLGLSWSCFHDKVEYPNKKLYRKGWYDVWDGKNVLQRGIYGAQNHYRDGILDAKAIDRVGAEWSNLHWFNHIMPYVYERDRLVADNYHAYIRQSKYLHRILVSSFTRIRSAADLEVAAKTSVTCMRTLADVRKVLNLTGARAHDAAEPAVQFARYGGDISINSFSKTHVSGTDILRIDLDVSSSDGMADVTIHDCDRRVLARFDPKGAFCFKTSFDFLHDKQSYLILAATDRKGHRAISVPIWCWYYHAGMNRCTDNMNLLSLRPALINQLHWDGDSVAAWKRLFGAQRHNHISEMNGWEGLEIPSRRPTAEAWSYWTPVVLKDIDFPGAEHSASGSTEFTLDCPNFVGIIDQRLGDYRTVRSHGKVNASFHDGCELYRDGENPYYRHRRRVYQFVDRIDTFWYATRKTPNPGYRGGYAITEGAIEFLKDVELAVPVTLLRITARNPIGETRLYQMKAGPSFSRGSYAALVSNPHEWYGVFGMSGTNAELRANVSRGSDEHEKVLQLELGRKGIKYPSGTKLAYRFATGSFVDDPEDGKFLGRFAGMMDGTLLPIEVKRGRVKSVNGMVELEAADGVAEAKLGPVDFIQDYPVVISGLTDNGSAVATNGKKWKPLGFESGKAYIECALEPGDTWTFQNLYAADNSAVRFTVVPAMAGHPKETVEIFNPTDRDITTTVRDVRRAETFTVTLPARSITER